MGGEYHYPVEISYESRKGVPGFYTELRDPAERYHKSLVDLGPAATLDEATDVVYSAAYFGDEATLLGSVWANYTGGSVREVFRAAFAACAEAGQEPKWDFKVGRGLVERFEAMAGARAGLS
jgi:hypothetical protein